MCKPAVAFPQEHFQALPMRDIVLCWKCSVMVGKGCRRLTRHPPVSQSQSLFSHLLPSKDKILFCVLRVVSLCQQAKWRRASGEYQGKKDNLVHAQSWKCNDSLQMKRMLVSDESHYGLTPLYVRCSEVSSSKWPWTQTGCHNVLGNKLSSKLVLTTN